MVAEPICLDSVVRINLPMMHMILHAVPYRDLNDAPERIRQRLARRRVRPGDRPPVALRVK